MMAGLLMYPRGVGLLDEIGDASANLVAPPDVPIAVGAFAGDGADGTPRVLVALPLPTGNWLVAEISLALFLTAADAACTVHGDPRRLANCPRCGHHRD